MTHPHVSQDWSKLRAAMDAVDHLPEGADKAALTFAVLQWFHAGFVSHEPLSSADLAWAEKVVERINAKAKQEV